MGEAFICAMSMYAYGHTLSIYLSIYLYIHTHTHTVLITAAKENIVKSILKHLYDRQVKEDVQDLDRELKDKLNGLNEEINRAAKEARAESQEIYDDAIEWIRSRDPVSVKCI